MNLHPKGISFGVATVIFFTGLDIGENPRFRMGNS